MGVSRAKFSLALDTVARVISVEDDGRAERKGSMTVLWNRSALRLDFRCFTAMESNAVSSRKIPVNRASVPVE